MRILTAGAALTLAVIAGCKLEVDLPPPRSSLDFDFNGGDQGWVAGFADLPVNADAGYALHSDHRRLPAPLSGRHGIYITGNNHSDDLFMYLKRRVAGLDPNTAYQASLWVEFATDVPFGCGGIGGQPGESVVVKAGASTIEPLPVAENDWLVMNIDKGNQSESGANAIVIGDVANSTHCEQRIRRYELKQLATPRPVPVTTDATGALWLIVGTDSGFEGATTLYYTRVSAELTKP